MSQSNNPPFPVPPDEDERLDELHSYDILDTSADPGFDNVTASTSEILDVPVVLVSLVDRRRLWFKSNHGIDFREVEREASLCNAVTNRGETVRIPDTHDNESASENSLVTEHDARSYLGSPLETPDGHVIGTICAIDTAPRDFDERDETFLNRMAEAVMEKLELSRSKQLLEEKNQQFELAEQIADIGHWSINAEAETVDWSDEIYRIIGMDPDREPPDLDEAIDLYHPDDREDLRQVIEEAIEDGACFETRQRLYDQSGTIHHVKIIREPQTDDSGTVTELFGVIKDVTDEVNKQREIQRKEKLASLAEIAGSIMHEINNPNGVIKGNVDYLEDLYEVIAARDPDDHPGKLLSQLTDELPEILDALRNSSQRIEEITNNVNTIIARLHSDTPTEKSSLDRVVDLTGATINEIRDDRDVKIETTFNLPDNSSGTVPLAGEEWKTLLENLLDNAVDATEPIEDGSIEVELNANEALHVSVNDEGDGLPEDLKTRITDPFFSTKNKASGTGLDLSVVSALIEDAGGEITFTTPETGGTSVQVTLPLDD